MSFPDEIDALSQKSSEEHAYPRPDLISLSQYLKSWPTQKLVAKFPETSAVSEEDVTTTFALIHEIATGTCSRFKPSPAGLAELASHSVEHGPLLLFLRGHGSPEWLNTIGEKYGVSPELYRRHLQYLEFRGRDLYSSPSLPSSSARVFQLTIPTICTRNVDGSGYEPEDLQLARRLEEEAMGRYFKQLRSKAEVADSVVRKCLLLSKQHYVVEQTVSIEVGPPGDDWRAVVWLDSGKDLCQTMKGPWSPRAGTKAWETYFFPVIVNPAIDTPFTQSTDKPSTPLAGLTSVHDIMEPQSHTGDRQAEEWKAAQNVALLPFQYGSRLNKRIARRDTLYALNQVFQFSASAEVQFLNLLQSRIVHELSFVGAQGDGKYHSISLLNLKYIKTQLTSHAQSLTETVSLLQNRHDLDWPHIERSDEDSATVERSANMLLSDFKYLLQRAATLAKQCDQGMTTLVNSSMLEESRRSANLATKVQRLTVIATIFIPLSFVCSVWGMNIDILGSGSQPFWKSFVSAVPIILLSLVIYQWDVLIRLYDKSKSGTRRRRETQDVYS
ncbi:hypothetical protein QBC33DRAFT_71366 [Phialemonium atrogriseum]|uniref:Uncharacterized protein n=1 Tax=Phialemonium atrogriseum TaxID=1093897 RepID=A0AAJ0C0F2_9PEZI|nr:uncharacterized protein QBC33DRAFT_71366 [Phialemonium atrogriseum]KAK1767611.1 hypothetical protein QBC33DRAFT_71366 [Phialemonium atrogriseum]